ncbi:hypothetical protein [Streptomyces sp. TP-A0874]|uniref:hypothetical protein n=1 Tax=Streptomyces sp. TP-A0874 TaxID=549819 RepID=UPI000852AABC|nr:hypothetical protein [Streptomyces sp. TP-A0874]
MPQSVQVRCPVCHREHSFTPLTLPCSCGAPLTPPISGDPPVPLRHHTWEGSWVTVRCLSCERLDDWPSPELGCSCGALLRFSVPPPVAAAPLVSRAAEGLRVPAPARRPAFRPVTIRTGQDAVTAGAEYLKWLGFRDVRPSEARGGGEVSLYGTGVVARVDPTTRPSTVRDVECLWLHGLNASAVAVFFSLAGYGHQARARADGVRLPLFVMDLTGTPRPVNDAADELARTGP